MPASVILFALIALPLACVAQAQDAASPASEPAFDPPTLLCLAVTWVISGDENANARVDVDCRRAGEDTWRPQQPLWRVDREQYARQPAVTVPPGGWLFAGSILNLTPDTEYEVRLRLSDPDGGEAERILKAQTRAEPALPRAERTLHVVPGSGGGDGSEAAPFQGLRSAEAAARPGDRFLLHAGVYEGQFLAAHSGEPGRPIVWMAAGDGEAAIDGKGDAEKRPGRAISACEVHDVWFEGLTVRNADYGIVAHRSARVTVRGCHVYGCDFAFTCTSNDGNRNEDNYLADNVLEGPCTWPRTKGIENPRGIQITGQGHVVCHNRIRGYADAVDTFGSGTCLAIDIYRNDISEMTDDGIETDYSQRNVRCFENRIVNVFQGISEQPLYGGPVYILRNVLYNVVAEPFKMHNEPSGGLIYHNSCVKQGMALQLSTGETVRRFVLRNNLLIGTTANYAYENTAPMVDCDFDYDGWGGGPFGMFLKWNGVRYRTFEEMVQNAPIERHAVRVEAATAFRSGLAAPPDPTQVYAGAGLDFGLAEGCAAVDAGEVLPGINDGFAGNAPDLGAYEVGAAAPQYGPRVTQ
jgi:hypothetical protein